MSLVSGVSWPTLVTLVTCKLNSMSEISGHTDQKPIGVREGAHERRGSLMKTPATMQNADSCVAVLFFSRVPVSFPLFLVPLSFTFEL